MSIAVWVAISIAIVYASAPVTSGGLRTLDDKALARYVHKRGLPLPYSLRDPVMNRIRATERAAVACGSVGVVVGAVLAFVLERVGSGSTGWGALALAGASVGAALGGFVATRRSPQLLPHAPRVARATATTVADYVTPGERRAFWLVPGVIAAGIAAACVWWALLSSKPEGHLTLMAIATIVPLVLLGTWALMLPATNRVLAAPQRATTDLELAWDDATRSDALRGLLDVGITAGFAAPLVSLSVVANLMLTADLGDDLVWMGFGALLTGLVLWIVLLIPYASGRAVRNPSRSLWAGRAFGEDNLGGATA
ncbi:hypothetical protein ACQCX5_04735 [Propionibacteriaceae bacterium G57]|uniref:hypothetical protein n=1 Tax=Aestuariimicrobium sp. G57 TaxID=3418485 RepID=UPI003DA6DEC7